MKRKPVAAQPLEPRRLGLRIATYNVHKCRGMDGRMRPERIASVLQTLDADIIGLQEVLDVRTGRPEHDQAQRIAAALPNYDWRFGHNRTLHGGQYGNMTLSRLTITAHENYDVTHSRRERRGCLRTDVEIAPGRQVRAFNLHLGTGFLERRHQAEYLLDLLHRLPKDAPRTIFGDFNEWTHGLASQRLARNFHTFEPRTMLQRARTYPGFLPFLHLDHFYYDTALHLDRMHLVRSREALLASDHLPLVADFRLVDT